MFAPVSAVVADGQGSAREAGGPCRPGTKGCICGSLSALYERGELVLWAGRVQRRALARKLGETMSWAASTSEPRRRSKAPARCILRFDRLLNEGCICGTLSALHERGELVLRAGKVDRRALARKLGVTSWWADSPAPGRRSKPPGRCIVRFDRLLKEHGSGRLWAEGLPALRAYLERCKESGTLPMTKRGRLNRSAVLREFAPERKAPSGVLDANPDVKALLDEYDVLQDDERYSPYKYDALAGELKELFDRGEFELVLREEDQQGRLLPEGWASGARCFLRPQARCPHPGEAGGARRVAAAGGDGEGVPGPRSGSHQLGSNPVARRRTGAFSISPASSRSTGLRSWSGLPRRSSRSRGTWLLHGRSTRVSSTSSHGWRRCRSPRSRGGCATGSLVDPREFVRVALLYQQEVVYGETREGRNVADSRLRIIEKLGEAGLFPRVQFPRSVDRRRQRLRNARPSLAEAPLVDADARKILEAAEAGSKYRDLDLGAEKDAIAFARRWRSSGPDGPTSRSRCPRPSGSCATSGSSSFERRRPRSSNRGARRTGRAGRYSRRPSMTVCTYSRRSRRNASAEWGRCAGEGSLSRFSHGRSPGGRSPISSRWSRRSFMGSVRRPTAVLGGVSGAISSAKWGVSVRCSRTFARGSSS